MTIFTHSMTFLLSLIGEKGKEGGLENMACWYVGCGIQTTAGTCK